MGPSSDRIVMEVPIFSSPEGTTQTILIKPNEQKRTPNLLIRL